MNHLIDALYWHLTQVFLINQAQIFMDRSFTSVKTGRIWETHHG